MLCDDVFDRLTRGPFPAGDPQDEAVEAHLDHCDSCRELALALEPAVALFHEALGDEAARDLPAYWGRQSRMFAMQSQLDEPDRTDPEPAVRFWTNSAAAPVATAGSSWRASALAAALLIAVTGALTVGLVQLGAQPVANSTQQAVGSTPETATATPESQGSNEPLVIDVAAACLAGGAEVAHVGLPNPSPTVANVGPGEQVANLTLRLAGFGHQLPLSATDASRLQCCTYCHAAGSEPAKAQRVNTHRVIKSCQACHLAMK